MPFDITIIERRRISRPIFDSIYNNQIRKPPPERRTDIRSRSTPIDTSPLQLPTTKIPALLPRSEIHFTPPHASPSIPSAPSHSDVAESGGSFFESLI